MEGKDVEARYAFVAVDTDTHVYGLEKLLDGEVVPDGPCAVPDEVMVSDQGGKVRKERVKEVIAGALTSW